MINHLLLLLVPAQLWQEISELGRFSRRLSRLQGRGLVVFAPIVASMLAPARQGVASVTETFLLYLG